MTEAILDQSQKSEHGIVHMIAGRPIHLPELDDVDGVSEPAIRFKVAMDAVNEAHTEMNRVKADLTLSDLGKTRKLDPRRELLIIEIAQQVEAIDSYSAHLDKREAVLLAVPELHPQNAAEAIIDRELRDWWKDQARSVRFELLNKMNEAPGHERLEIALLRSPYAQADVEVRQVREAWNNAKRLEWPEEAQAIAMGRNQLEWSSRAFAHLTPIGMLLSELPNDRLLSVLIKKEKPNKTIEAFGYDVQSIERAKRMLKR